MNKFSEKLQQRYLKEIRDWDWPYIAADAKTNAHDPEMREESDEQYIGRTFLGTVFALAPSGKYYMPWTTNQTAKDEIRDQAFYEALDTVADEHDLWIENGEGDPCDIFACVAIPVEG